MTDVEDKLTAWITVPRDRPLAIAHRGASAYVADNTLKAFRLAADLGADMWEVDIQVSRDGIPVVCHDQDLVVTAGRPDRIRDLDAADLATLPTLSGEPIPLFAEVVDLAQSLGCALYLDVKDLHAAKETLAILEANRVEKAIFGTTDVAFCRQLKSEGCNYPVSLLVGLDMDVFALADESGADIIHPCWEKAGDRPDHLLDADFFSKANDRGLPVVIWHEERRDVAKALCDLPVLAICSDTPQLLKPYRELFPDDPEVVCHRGANWLAPENTLSAAHAAFAGGYQFVELDTHSTADGELVVIHDADLERTTDGRGKVKDFSLAELQELDAGSWHSHKHAGETIPKLRDMIDCASHWDGHLYIELKQADPAAVLDLVSASDFIDRCFFWSFDSYRLRQLRNLSPEATIMARREDYQTLAECLADLQPGIVEFNLSNIDGAEFEEVREAGSRVMVAYMGHRLEDMQILSASKPDIVNIDSTMIWTQHLKSMR